MWRYVQNLCFAGPLQDRSPREEHIPLCPHKTTYNAAAVHSQRCGSEEQQLARHRRHVPWPSDKRHAAKGTWQRRCLVNQIGPLTAGGLAVNRGLLAGNRQRAFRTAKENPSGP